MMANCCISSNIILVYFIISHKNVVHDYFKFNVQCDNIYYKQSSSKFSFVCLLPNDEDATWTNTNTIHWWSIILSTTKTRR